MTNYLGVSTLCQGTQQEILVWEPLGVGIQLPSSPVHGGGGVPL